MARLIPVNGALTHSRLQCQLDGTSFGLEFRWNERASGWFFSIYAADGTLLLANRRLVVNWLLTARFRDTRLPLGDFIATDTSGQNQEAGLNDLGTRVVVKYLEAKDFPPGGA